MRFVLTVLSTFRKTINTVYNPTMKSMNQSSTLSFQTDRKCHILEVYLAITTHIVALYHVHDSARKLVMAVLARHRAQVFCGGGYRTKSPSDALRRLEHGI